MDRKTFLSVGECMIEMAALENGDFRLGFAGDTMNTAWYVRACLPQESWNVAYFTRLGEDPYSAKMLNFFTENGIDTSRIGRDPTRRPGLYMIEITDGERSFTYWRDQSAAKTLADDRVFMSSAFEAADVIYFSGITMAILPEAGRSTLLEELAAARRVGKTTVFDPNLRPRLWSSPEVMRATTMQAAGVADIVLPSFDDEAAHFGDADLDACADRYLAAGAKSVLVKNGGGPMLFAGAESRHRMDALERVKPVDTTGAGDSFNGGFLSALMSGAPAETAIVKGHAVSLQVIMHRGALMPMADVKA
ncbi:sugar kinase [Rhizobium sp. C1]|uniref:sugar kinase n=1 Tax=Rhizobium sp. C1 TaxID=1349799 RepID=UPI001E3AFCFA|nr:sugar kinase [Rhizobium sp. C1]MCD2178073.1 sugar kinase [Rhizobium sp. C1]